MGASPADFPLGSPHSRALARAWAEAKSPRSSEDVQRDGDALQLYHMMFELYGQTYPDSNAIRNHPIIVRASELGSTKYAPIVPLHKCPSWSRSTKASREFERCFYREPKAGDLLRWQHVSLMRGPEMNEARFRPQIEAWHRQLAGLPCPLKFENGRLFKRQRNGDWLEEASVNWLSHWIHVGIDAGLASQDIVQEVPTESGNSAVNARASYVLGGVTFLGVIEGKHLCRPATEEELGRPETDALFRGLRYDDPAMGLIFPE